MSARFLLGGAALCERPLDSAYDDPSQIAGGGGDKKRHFPVYIPPTYEEKKRKPVQPIWDRVRQQKAEEERRRAQAPKEPAPPPRKAGPPPADIFESVAPVVHKFPVIDAHDDVPRISRQMSDARDFADISAALSSFGPPQQSHDTQDMADIADVLGQLAAMTQPRA